LEHGAGTWTGRRGSVTDAVDAAILAGRPDFVAACGPPAMLAAVARRLRAARVPARSISFAIERQMKCGVGRCGRC